MASGSTRRRPRSRWRGCSPRSRGSFRIPGTTKLSRLDEDLGAVSLELTSDELRVIEQADAQITVQGDRYQEHLARMTGR